MKKICSADLAKLIESKQLAPSKYFNDRQTSPPSVPKPPLPKKIPTPKKKRRKTVAPQSNAVAPVGQKKPPPKTYNDYVGKTVFIAQIQGKGFVRKTTLKGVEEVSLVQKQITASRFRSRKAARSAALAWGKLNGKPVLRDDVKIIERTIL